MKSKIGIWIGIIAGLGGFAAGLAAVILTTGKDAIWITAIMLSFFGGMFYLFYRIFFKPMLNARRLMRIGLPGKAKVLEVRDTGVTINNSPQVKLIIELKNTFGQKYTTDTRVLVSRLNPWLYTPGMEVPVKIDPANEKNVVIDTTDSFQKVNSSVADTTALTAEIEALQAEQAPIRISGRSARAIVKEYKWLGIYINGNNPYAELSVEVLPENAASFSANTKGVIAGSSVAKFQPGQEIMVRYDYYDNTKVVIDHSL